MTDPIWLTFVAVSVSAIASSLYLLIEFQRRRDNKNRRTPQLKNIKLCFDYKRPSVSVFILDFIVIEPVIIQKVELFEKRDGQENWERRKDATFHIERIKDIEYDGGIQNVSGAFVVYVVVDKFINNHGVEPIPDEVYLTLATGESTIRIPSDKTNSQRLTRSYLMHLGAVGNMCSGCDIKE